MLCSVAQDSAVALTAGQGDRFRPAPATVCTVDSGLAHSTQPGSLTALGGAGSQQAAPRAGESGEPASAPKGDFRRKRRVRRTVGFAPPVGAAVRPRSRTPAGSHAPRGLVPETPRFETADSLRSPALRAPGQTTRPALLPRAAPYRPLLEHSCQHEQLRMLGPALLSAGCLFVLFLFRSVTDRTAEKVTDFVTCNRILSKVISH